MAEQKQEKIKALHISLGKHDTNFATVIWHHTIPFLNDTNWGAAVHLDNEKLWWSEENVSWDNFKDIEKLVIIDDIPDYEFIGQLTQLRSLTIINSKIFNNLNLIEGLEKLEYIQLIQCYQVSDIAPIIRLRNKQAEKRSKAKPESIDSWPKFIYDYPVLQNIALVDCNISSLEAFREDSSPEMDELHLRWNHIRDITPLGVKQYAYLDLSHNHIEDITPLFDSEDTCYYGINLRHNLIKDMSGINIPNTGIPGRIKIWINYNHRIPSEQLIKWKETKHLWIMDMELKPTRPKGAPKKNSKKKSKPD